MIEEILKAHLKDGLLAVLLIYLLWTDRIDRKEDREFWSNFFKDNKEKKD